jgi:hypothetical protein
MSAVSGNSAASICPAQAAQAQRHHGRPQLGGGADIAAPLVERDADLDVRHALALTVPSVARAYPRVEFLREGFFFPRLPSPNVLADPQARPQFGRNML